MCRRQLLDTPGVTPLLEMRFIVNIFHNGSHVYIYIEVRQNYFTEEKKKEKETLRHCQIAPPCNKYMDHGQQEKPKHAKAQNLYYNVSVIY